MHICCSLIIFRQYSLNSVKLNSKEFPIPNPTSDHSPKIETATSIWKRICTQRNKQTSLSCGQVGQGLNDHHETDSNFPEEKRRINFPNQRQIIEFSIWTSFHNPSTKRIIPTKMENELNENNTKIK
ncbi:hypothetical protein WA026_000540 [Henosepilachna vigintioctopunctata]|uniref:Uncharacterized protein n=1 Tax=Henosepilachna vigintioctopunctata TaxID=420089 RepID=A0AAW1V6C0_9CUCU